MAKYVIFAVLCAGLLAPLLAVAQDTPLVLELVLNGRHTGQIGQFLERNGQVLAQPDELQALGFVVSNKRSTEPLPVADIPGVKVRVNRQQQTLEVTAADEALQPKVIQAGRLPRLGPLTPAEWGIVANYDVTATWPNSQDSGGAFVEGRILSPYGTLSSTELYQFNPDPDVPQTLRLDTTYTYSDPDLALRWRVGDVVPGALNWTRSVRLGGIQVATDFGMRPDLITYPLPVFSASAAVPSTVDLIVNGARTFSQPVSPGPFQLNSLPSVSGSGEAVVSVTNALGQQTLITVPFYITPELLQAGLASYSFAAGEVRQGYGVLPDSYEDGAYDVSARYGLTNWLTLEGHAEGTVGTTLGGGGAVMRIGTFGVISGAIAGSAGNGSGNGFHLAGPTTGVLGTIGFERQTPHYSISASVSQATAGYRDIAVMQGTPYPRKSLLANFGLPLGQWGSLNLIYIGEHYDTLDLASGHLPQIGYGLSALPGQESVSQVSLSYGVRLTDKIGLIATAEKDLQQGNQFGMLVGLTFSLGGISVGSSVSSQNGSIGEQFSAQKTAQAPGDYGFTLSDSEGVYTQRTGEVDYISPWGQVTAGVSQYDNSVAGRLGASGALVAMDGHVFASDHIQDSFAIVSSGDLPDVRVTSDNRPAGRTDADGLLLVPNLQSYGSNSVALNPNDIPADFEVQKMRVVIRPEDRSGVQVDFGVRPSNPALLRLVLPNGHPVPVQSSVRIGHNAPAPVGYGGEAYVTGLDAQNTAEVALPDGRRCHAHFAFRHVRGDIPTIGPLRCE